MLRFILFALISCPCFAQSKYEKVGEANAVVFKTEYGSWTALHVGMDFKPTHFSAALDIQFRRSKVRNKIHYKLGKGPPVKFVTRRGKSFSINASELDSNVWSIDNFRFFSGESGSPVFNSKGEVCGVVLGNYFKGRWHGRVAKIEKFVEQLEAKDTVEGILE